VPAAASGAIGVLADPDSEEDDDEFGELHPEDDALFVNF
jgi:hypothetical protein